MMFTCSDIFRNAPVAFAVAPPIAVSPDNSLTRPRGQEMDIEQFDPEFQKRALRWCLPVEGGNYGVSHFPENS